MHRLAFLSSLGECKKKLPENFLEHFVWGWWCTVEHRKPNGDLLSNAFTTCFRCYKNKYSFISRFDFQSQFQLDHIAQYFVVSFIVFCLFPFVTQNNVYTGDEYFFFVLLLCHHPSPPPTLLHSLLLVLCP